MLLSGFPGRVGAEEIWRGVSLVYWFRRRDAARGSTAPAIGPAGRCSGGVVMICSYDLLVEGRVNLPCQPHARARGPGRDPAVTGSLANEVGRAKTAEGSRACFSPAFPGRVGAEEIWRGVSLVYWFRQRDAARGSTAPAIGPAGRCSGGVVQRRPALTSLVTLTRARGPGRGPAATGSLANEIGRAKTAERVRLTREVNATGCMLCISAGSELSTTFKWQEAADRWSSRAETILTLTVASAIFSSAFPSSSLSRKHWCIPLVAFMYRPAECPRDARPY